MTGEQAGYLQNTVNERAAFAVPGISSNSHKQSRAEQSKACGPKSTPISRQGSIPDHSRNLPLVSFVGRRKTWENHHVFLTDALYQCRSDVLEGVNLQAVHSKPWIKAETLSTES